MHELTILKRKKKFIIKKNHAIYIQKVTGV